MMGSWEENIIKEEQTTIAFALRIWVTANETEAQNAVKRMKAL